VGGTPFHSWNCRNFRRRFPNVTACRLMLDRNGKRQASDTKDSMVARNFKRHRLQAGITEQPAQRHHQHAANDLAIPLVLEDDLHVGHAVSCNN